VIHATRLQRRCRSVRRSMSSCCTVSRASSITGSSRLQMLCVCFAQVMQESGAQRFTSVLCCCCLLMLLP